MRTFLVRRFFFALFTLFAITVVVFSLSQLGPDPLLVFVRGDSYGVDPEVIKELRGKWGLDRPLPVRYFTWLTNVLQGDFGRSIGSQKPVLPMVMDRVGASLQLGVVAWIIATVVGIPLGVLSAVKRGSFWDYFGRSVALIGQATPAFWFALVLILIFAVQLDLLPSAGRAADKSWATQIRYMILPALALGFEPWATYLRLTRSSMLEVLDQEYIKLARSKGVNPRAVIWKHAFRNALIQPITVSALVLASFIHGAVFVETIFAWPGLGRLAVTATLDNDFPVLTAVVLLFGVMYVFINFLADIAYSYIDPRIRYS